MTAPPERSAARAHPQTTPPEIVARILAIALECPDWGCVRVAERLKAEGPGVSSPTVQAILLRHGLGGKADRVRRLEELHLADGRALTPGQASLIARQNPAFREREAAPTRPGELLVQESFIVGYFDRLGKLYLHAVVDAFNGYAFAELYPGKRAEMAITVLHRQALPFYAARGLPVGAVLTDFSHAYGRYPYQLFLTLRDIAHRTTEVRGPSKHGVYQRFHDEVLAGCFRELDRGAGVMSLDGPREALAAWLRFYNVERPSPGFPNRGAPPLAALEAFRA